MILDLGKCGLTELPDELFELTALEELKGQLDKVLHNQKLIIGKVESLRANINQNMPKIITDIEQNLTTKTKPKISKLNNSLNWLKRILSNLIIPKKKILWGN